MNNTPMNQNLLATVDLGSNSFRLLIAKVDSDNTITPVDQIKETVRLAGGLDENNVLSDKAQQVALTVLSRFSERLAEFKHSQVRVVATSTLRIAKNAAEFITLGNKVLGFNIEVIPGREEARLIYIGAMHALAFTKDKRLVIDIGGGSTEFIIGSGYDPKIMESVTMGCVSYSNLYFPDGSLTKKNFESAILAARSKIQSMEYLFADHDWSIAVGTSGTASALYDLITSHHFGEQITLDALHKVRKLLQKHKNMNNLDKIAIKEDRRQVIAGGLAILIAVMEEFNIDLMTISDGALREGVMYDLLGRHSDHDLRDKTVDKLKVRYAIDNDQSTRVATTTLKIYTNLMQTKNINENYKKLLNWAASLYEIGLRISHSDYHKHGAYILANTDMAGFSKPEQTILSDLVRTHRGKLTKAINTLQETRQLKTWFLLMVVAFRLAVILNRNRVALPKDTFLNISLVNNKKIELEINQTWLTNNPLSIHSLNEEINQWKKADIKIVLKVVLL